MAVLAFILNIGSMVAAGFAGYVARDAMSAHVGVVNPDTLLILMASGALSMLMVLAVPWIIGGCARDRKRAKRERLAGETGGA